MLPFWRNAITTYTGQRFDFNAPSFTENSIYDIAHALSHLCRFTGHCREFYSVAQHSVLVAEYVEQNFEKAYHGINNREAILAALMHDAAEAYIGDVARPLKVMLPWYKVIEERVEGELRRFFCISSEFDALVKEGDQAVFEWEFYCLLPQTSFTLGIQDIVPWPPAVAERAFLEVFTSLMD